MSTRLEGVQIPVELDTSKAERQLDQLEAKLGKDSKKAVDLNRTLAQNTVLQKGSGAGGKSDTTGVSGTPRSQQSKDAVGQIPAFLQGSTPVSGVVGKLRGLAAGSATLAPLARGAAGAAALYAGTRAVAMGAPLALEAGRAFAGLSPDDPLFKAVQAQLDNLKNSFNYIESYVKSAITGVGKTYDMATAMARVNGKVPNIQIGYGIYKDADMQEDMLRKKFEHFKSMEVATAVGNSMAEMFKGGLNR